MSDYELPRVFVNAMLGDMWSSRIGSWHYERDSWGWVTPAIIMVSGRNLRACLYRASPEDPSDFELWFK